MKFSGILKSVEPGRFLRYRVGISGNLSKFFRFWFRVKVVYYKAFLLATGGGK